MMARFRSFTDFQGRRAYLNPRAVIAVSRRYAASEDALGQAVLDYRVVYLAGGETVRLADSLDALFSIVGHAE